MLERDVLASVRDALTRTGHLLLWRNSCGFDEGHKVPYGLGVGSADLVGLLRGTGRFFAVECKREKGGSLSDEQRLWLAIVVRMGGYACVVRSADEALAHLERALMGEKVDPSSFQKRRTRKE